MPEDSKKHDKKQAKEQRKPRQRHQQARTEKRPEKTEEASSAPKVTVPQKPPVYESPPPEFFKNLKRETDEILKITEEENSKYKKKEIQSNWSKYEVPIESYEQIDEQENMGADYEKLIEAPLSLGGHFQFKHEKSWDINTAPSQYDKYFEINMEDLNVALCTIPFYERNSIEQSTFNETDILTMNNRSTRFKQKYYNDKSYSTPETEVQDKILNSLRDSMKNEDATKNSVEINTDNDTKIAPVTEDKPNLVANINLEFENEPAKTVDSNKISEENILNKRNIVSEKAEPTIESNKIEEKHLEHDDFIFAKPSKTVIEQSEVKVPEVKAAPQTIPSPVETKVAPIESKVTPLETKVAPVETKVAPVETKVAPVETKVVPVQTKAASIETKVPQAAPKVADTQVESKKNPVIESPEDLEKWLDDFLDG